MRVGLVLEGGSFRGIFTAGVLDYLLEQQITFPYVCGVSAGAGNAVNYIAGQKGRTQKVIMHENADPYYGLGQMVKSGKLLNLDKMLYDYSYAQIPLDFDAFFHSGVESEYVVANCNTGEPEYMTPSGDEQQLLEICKASCSVPMLCNPVKLGNYEYLDGSTLDSIPFAHALEKCDKVVVIMTRMDEEGPTDYGKMRSLLNICYKYNYPKYLEKLLLRKEMYEEQIAELRKQEAAGKVLVIQPEVSSIGHFENDAEKILSFHKHGYEIMEKNLERLKAFIAE